MTLLREWLSPQQQAQFKEFGWFEVIGDGTGKRYRILYGAATNVHELDGDGQPQIGWCLCQKGIRSGDGTSRRRLLLKRMSARRWRCNRFPLWETISVRRRAW